MFTKSTQFKYFYSEESWTSISCNTEAEIRECEAVTSNSNLIVKVIGHSSTKAWSSVISITAAASNF